MEQELQSQTFECHTGRVKKLATDPYNSPGFIYILKFYNRLVFLSVSEDGTVRMFDLRIKHTCNRQNDKKFIFLTIMNNFI